MLERRWLPSVSQRYRNTAVSQPLILIKASLHTLLQRRTWASRRASSGRRLGRSWPRTCRPFGDRVSLSARAWASTTPSTPKSSLRNHQKWECGKEPQFQCPHCVYRAKQKMHISRHMERMHKEKLFKQELV
jgi:hypothetical protein